MFKTDNNEINDDNNSKTNKMIRNLSKNLTCISNIRAIGEFTFLTSNAKKTFNHL